MGLILDEAGHHYLPSSDCRKVIHYNRHDGIDQQRLEANNAEHHPANNFQLILAEFSHQQRYSGGNTYPVCHDHARRRAALRIKPPTKRGPIASFELNISTRKSHFFSVRNTQILEINLLRLIISVVKNMDFRPLTLRMTKKKGRHWGGSPRALVYLQHKYRCRKPAARSPCLGITLIDHILLGPKFEVGHEEVFGIS